MKTTIDDELKTKAVAIAAALSDEDKVRVAGMTQSDVVDHPIMRRNANRLFALGLITRHGRARCGTQWRDRCRLTALGWAVAAMIAAGGSP